MHLSRNGATYGNLEVHIFLGECAHLIVEAESVLSSLRGREDKVALALLLAIHNESLVWSDNLVVDIE